ncbi:MAG: hypothetical protein M0R70_13160 [Nitrospirae bacterium]|nr:hypothetical protein [Nitrospirota bacterium]
MTPVTALQLNVGVGETPVAPFDGALSVGGRRFWAVAWVVKLYVVDQLPLVVPGPLPRTRQ